MDELELLRYEVDVLRRRAAASMAREDLREALLVGVVREMIDERERRIRQLEQTLAP